MSEGKVLVEVVAGIGPGREIAWGQRSSADELERRLDEIRGAVTLGTNAIARSLGQLPSADGWRLDEASASFGIVLTAEASVLITKASAGTTFEVTVKFTREV